MREIQGFLAEQYGTEVSPEFIGSVTNAVMAEVSAWQGRLLEPMYPVVFFDTLCVKIKEQAVCATRPLALGFYRWHTQHPGPAEREQQEYSQLTCLGHTLPIARSSPISQPSCHQLAISMICSDKLTADKLCNDLNMRQVRLKFADGIRGLAALWVVLFHASEGGHIEHLKAAAPALLTHIVFDLGHLGVPAFFVLSGFVMMLVAERARFDRYGSLVFLARRMIRLGPPFYVSIVIVLLFLALKHFTTGAPMPSIDWKILLGHITYTQSLFDMPLLNSVYWTLSVEVQFYIAFAMIMLIADRWSTPERRAATRAWCMVVSALVGLPWVFGLITHPLYPGSFLPFWASFAAGVLACLSWRQTGAMRSALWIYVVILATTAAWQSSSFVAVAAFTSASLALAGQLKRMDVWLKWRWCQFLGLVSYSLYLVHNPITGAGFNVLKHFFPHNALGEAASLIVVVAICLVVSYALYLAVERTSIGWSHKFGKQRE